MSINVKKVILYAYTYATYNEIKEKKGGGRLCSINLSKELI